MHVSSPKLLIRVIKFGIGVGGPSLKLWNKFNFGLYYQSVLNMLHVINSKLVTYIVQI